MDGLLEGYHGLMRVFTYLPTRGSPVKADHVPLPAVETRDRPVPDRPTTYLHVSRNNASLGPDTA